MMWPFGRSLLEERQHLVLHLLFVDYIFFFFFRKTELTEPSSLGAAYMAAVFIVTLFSLQQLFSFGLFTIRLRKALKHTVYLLPKVFFL